MESVQTGNQFPVDTNSKRVHERDIVSICYFFKKK